MRFRRLVLMMALLVLRYGAGIYVDGSCALDRGARSADCSFRGLEDVPDLPPWVESLDLTGNPLGVLKNNAFHSLETLNVLVAAKCQLRRLEGNAFLGISQLKHLDLGGNPLNESVLSIPEDVFYHLSELERLNLDDCNFMQSIPDSPLSQLVSLKELVIKGPQKLNFGSEFRKLTKLQMLLVRKGVNELYNDTFVNVPFLRNLWLDKLVFNRIETGVFVPLYNLQALTIHRCNNITFEAVLDSMYGLRHRNLSSIWLEKVYTDTSRGASLESFGYLGHICLTNLTLRNNFIGYINAAAFLFQFPKCLRVLHLDMSEYVSTRLLQFFLAILQFSSLEDLEISRLTETCGSRLDVPDQGNRTLNISGTVQLGSIVFLPGRLQVLRGRCWVIKDTLNKVTTVSNGGALKELDVSFTTLSGCTGRMKGLTSLEILRISGFNCSKLNPRLLHDMPTLQTFVAASAQLGYGFGNDTDGVFFTGLKQLSYVDVSRNSLRLLHANLFQDQGQSLRVLDLSTNALQTVPQTVLALARLSKLDLRHNQIETLTKGNRHKFDDLSASSNKTFKLLLSGNSFKCDCDSLDFIHWLFTTSVLLDDSGNYGCVNDDGNPSTTLSVYQNLEATRKACGSIAWFVGALLFLFGILGILIVSSLLYHYRFSIQYWCLRFGYRKIPGEDGFQHDAFVAYDHRDSGWVCNTMRGRLETDNQLQLCLHERDFVPGNFIADNILDAIEKSRTIVMVVSRNFLNSRWCEFEMEMTRAHVFTGGRDRRKAVVVLLENIPRADMPPALQNLWGRVTCLKYPNCTPIMPDEENVFWDRLGKALRE